MVSKIFYVHPYLGKWSKLTNIFQLGWFNHQLENVPHPRGNTLLYNQQLVPKFHRFFRMPICWWFQVGGHFFPKNHPWGWYIYLHVLDFTIKTNQNVGRYTSPMDDMGLYLQDFLPPTNPPLTQPRTVTSWPWFCLLFIRDETKSYPATGWWFQRFLFYLFSSLFGEDSHFD